MDQLRKASAFASKNSKRGQASISAREQVSHAREEKKQSRRKKVKPGHDVPSVTAAVLVRPGHGHLRALIEHNLRSVVAALVVVLRVEQTIGVVSVAVLLGQAVVGAAGVVKVLSTFERKQAML